MPDGVTGEDIAYYAVLSALAALDRVDVRKKLLDSESFGAVLTCAPQLRPLLDDFCQSRYASLFERFARLRPRMKLDSVIAPLLNELETRIRQRALVQYFSPYSVVDLKRMAESFACDVEALEEELAALIADDHIAARIDSYNKRLNARQSDERADMYAEVLAAGEAYVRNTQALLMRMSLQKADLVVRAPRETRASAHTYDRPGDKRRK